MKPYILIPLLLLPTQLLAEQYLCRSESRASLTEKESPANYIDFEESNEWVVDSAQGWKSVFPDYEFIGSCLAVTSNVDEIDLLECTAFLSTFVINLSGMTFAYSSIIEGNSATYPSIEIAIGKCEAI